jgi:hypothetical protein
MSKNKKQEKSFGNKVNNAATLKVDEKSLREIDSSDGITITTKKHKRELDYENLSKEKGIKRRFTCKTGARSTISNKVISRTNDIVDKDENGEVLEENELTKIDHFLKKGIKRPQWDYKGRFIILVVFKGFFIELKIWKLNSLMLVQYY